MIISKLTVSRREDGLARVAVCWIMPKPLLPMSKMRNGYMYTSGLSWDFHASSYRRGDYARLPISPLTSKGDEATSWLGVPCDPGVLREVARGLLITADLMEGREMLAAAKLALVEEGDATGPAGATKGDAG